MVDKTELQERYDFHIAAAKELRKAYIALVNGGVQSYTIGSRSLSKFDLQKITAEIKDHEKQADSLAAQLRGGGRRKAVGIVPQDW